MLNDPRIKRPRRQTYFERIKAKLFKVIAKKNRVKLNNKYKEEVQKKDFTIIASFCGAGTLYHDNGMKFLSPTINLAFDGPDFCSFCENLQFYLKQELVEYKTDKVPYPVGKLGNDVEVRFVHYKSFEDAKKKWEKRTRRINYKKILIMCTDRDGMNLPECIERFDKLAYPKIMFSAKNYHKDWDVYCPCFKDDECVGIMTGTADLQGRRFYEKYTNIIEVLNSLK